MPSEERSARFFTQIINYGLNMPGMNGVELLQWLQENPIPNLIAKVVLTSTEDPAQLEAAYAFGAAGIFRKPSGHEQLGTLLRRIYDYWSISEILSQQPYLENL